MQAAAMAAHYQPAAGPSRPHIMTSFPTPALPPQQGTQSRSDRAGQPSGWTSPTSYGPGPGHVVTSPSFDMTTSPLDDGVRREDSTAKRNPFADLIDTEKIYVDQLTLVIRVRPATLQTP